MTLCRADASCPAPVPGQELQAGEAAGMESEKPGPEGPQGRSLGQGWHLGVRGSGEYSPPSSPAPWSLPRWRAYLAAAVLCYINLLNYMNWFIIAGEEGEGLPGRHLPICPPPPHWPPSHQQVLCMYRVLLSSKLSSWGAYSCCSSPRGGFSPA